MSDPENLDYLQPGFDPKSLTIPRLRSILVAHNVPYSSSAKKGQLVDIFNEQVVPQAKKILDLRARAKRSSRGIVDADSVGSNHIDPFDEREDLAPPTPRPVSSRRSRSPRKTVTRIKSEEPDFNAPMPPPVPSSPSKRSSRYTSRQSRASSTEVGSEVDGNTSSRRLRSVTPKLEPETSDGFFKRTSDVFTSDNPFQSGSSPAGVERTPSRHRRTTGHNASRSVSRGAPEVVADHGFADGDELDTYGDDMPTPRPKSARHKTPEPRFELPKSQPRTPRTVEAGEEFTPQEQLELAAEEAIKGQAAMAPVRQADYNSKASSTTRKTPILMLLVTMLGIYAGWYRQEKIAVGFCGAGRTVSSIPSAIEVPEWAQSILPAEITVPPALIDALEPECEPCPPHAYCFGDFTVQCEQDYILKPHPFALGGVVPLPPTCEPDGEKVLRVKAVADRVIEELRVRAAKYECRLPIDEEGTIVDTPAMEELELKQNIAKKRSRKMSNQEFEDIWGPAISEAKRREEVQVEVKETTESGAVPNIFLSSTSLARVPLTCAVRRSIRLGLARHRFQISVVIALVLTVLYGRSRFLSDRAAAAMVPALVDDVLDRLAQQKERGNEDEMEDPWLFLPNLRDVVLRSTHSLRQRERIWRRVVVVVEQNSNVRTSQREGRSGEVGRAWEWIGPTTGDSGRRRKSGRVSFGPGATGAEDSPLSEEHSFQRRTLEDPRPVC
ncbi:Man1-Src1p-C-terminal domain-containing protein [Xylaria sp. CBS 124048]|nr:Man1-Src1p-C-terminal domain-containing protein [Xylaria sp. CBS 124048]